MVAEIGKLIALPGKEDLLRDALTRARSVLSRAPGYGGSTFYQSIEHPRQFCLVVLWETIEAHMKNFREGPLFDEWRLHLNPFMDVHAIQPGISFSHFTAIAGGESIERPATSGPKTRNRPCR
jgi:heme-degrading monooxygenase HmoA